MYAEVRNVFDRTYIASANNITNSVSAVGLQGLSPTGSIYAGSPRAFFAGIKLAFK
jgi:iron complex outermembrane receptor protein